MKSLSLLVGMAVIPVVLLVLMLYVPVHKFSVVNNLHGLATDPNLAQFATYQYMHLTMMTTQKVSDYDREMPYSHTAD